METQFNFPDYKEVVYLMNPETGYYQKQPQKISFNKLPFELKVENTIEEKIRQQGAKEIIHGRIKNGKYQFFTGLIPTSVRGFYEGNDYEFRNKVKKLSLIVFYFSEDNSKLSVYYFNHFYKVSSIDRQRFVFQFIKFIQKEKA